MKTLGNLFIALGIVALGLPTAISAASGNGAFYWLEAIGENNPIAFAAVGGGSLFLIVLGIIVRNIGIRKAKKEQAKQQALQQQMQLQQMQLIQQQQLQQQQFQQPRHHDNQN